MFWFVFLLSGKPGCLLPRETPPSRVAVLGVPGCRRPAEPRGCGRRRRSLRSSGRGGAFLSVGVYARPGIGGLVLAVGGGGERGLPRHPCGKQPRALVFKNEARECELGGQETKSK